MCKVGTLFYSFVETIPSIRNVPKTDKSANWLITMPLI